MSTARVQLGSELSPLGGSIAEPRIMGFSEVLQRDHYAEIAAEYEAHYSDTWSLAYRRQFIYQPMFQGLNLSGLKVLDAMCGSGQTTEYLLEKQAEVTGLDLSDVVVDTFKGRWPTCQAVCRSLLDSGVPDASFDCVAVIGGLHHTHPHLSLAVREIHRILKPGGYFCFMEPHSGSFPDIIRKFWYKHDRFFSENEAAIDLPALEEEFGADFEFKRVEYSGNLAFLLVLNSLIFRVPKRLKPLYSPVLLLIESWLKKLQGKQTSCFVVGQWQKREQP